MGTWKIIPHSGCSVQDLFTSYNFKVQQAPGTGTPPIKNISTELGLLDGALFQRTRTSSRSFTLVGILTGNSVGDLHTKRKTLINALKPDRVNPQEPVVIQYTGGDQTLQASAYFDAGLEFNNPEVFHEAGLGLRFYSPDPFWEKSTSSSQSLSIHAEIANANHGIRRLATGSWAALPHSGVHGGPIRAWDGPSGSVIIGGDFVETGLSNPVAYGGVILSSSAGESIEAFSGDGTFNGVVKSISHSADRYYFAGAFSSVAGVAACTVAAKHTAIHSLAGGWEAMSASFTTVDSKAIEVAANGLIYAAGDNDEIHEYVRSSSAWSEVASANNDITVMKRGADGNIYAGGTFDEIAGASIKRIAKYTVSTSAWSALGTGMDDGSVNSIAFSDDGTIYAGGDFTEINGASISYVAQWNGTAWAKLGNGVNDEVRHLDYLDGVLYAGGDFDEAGGASVPGGLAEWLGSDWIPSDLTMPGSALVYSSYVDSASILYMGFSDAGTASAPNLLSITNGGTATTYPIITITGPGNLTSIRNFTTKQRLYFNIGLNIGEILTIDLSPGKKTVTSNFRGNTVSSVLPLSDLATWGLAPGANNVTIAVDDSTSSACIAWIDKYWSLDS